MKLIRLAAAGVLCLLALTPVAAQSDVAQLIAATRLALGGDAALDAIKSLAISGSLNRLVGPGVSERIEISYVAPDKFLRVSHYSPSGPISFDVFKYDGFNGPEPIRETDSPNAPFPVEIPANPSSQTPQQIAASRERQLKASHQIFLHSLLPLFVVPITQYGLETSAGGRMKLDKGEADAIDFKRSDGMTWRLLIDTSSRLPVALTWRAKPVVVTSTSSTMTTTVTTRGGSGGMPPSMPPPSFPPPFLPAGDPTIGLSEVDWIMTIRDYKVADGLNWPRRLTTSFAGKDWEDVRISRYRINPKIDPKVFERKKK